jgi:hypothetical protein
MSQAGLASALSLVALRPPAFAPRRASTACRSRSRIARISRPSRVRWQAATAKRPLKRTSRANEGAGPLPCSARIAGSRYGTNAVSKQVWIPSCMTAADCRSPSAMWERAEPITEALWLLPLVQGDNAQTRALHARNPWQSSRVGYTPAGGCFWAIATARQVCWTAESEQAQSRAAWARAGPRDRRDLDHPSVAWPGVAVISSLPSHALLPIVQSAIAC